ncbi:hypothetical protein T11_13235 [Trichinella zimbabwensis]|uniref:Uncharacterized protein n=1 Tax=Trichinella zimbabwensis TaxID=268475 RepID=A0A0V1G9P5_9BILA|nr:hypothetical protein T11_13235 [Trichinella zimbabwensis]
MDQGKLDVVKNEIKHYNLLGASSGKGMSIVKENYLWSCPESILIRWS